MNQSLKLGFVMLLVNHKFFRFIRTYTDVYKQYHRDPVENGTQL
jgi:hypothetical protein